MLTDVPEQNVHDMDAKATAEMAGRHRDVVVGIKSAHYQGPEWVSVDRAVEAGRAAGVPVMVDFGYFREERPYYKLVGEHLRPGDISTHMFRGPVPYMDADGKVLDYLTQARARGVLFDVGHGGGSFVFRTMVPADACRLLSGHHLDGPAHRQHERRDDRHADDDVEVPRRGDAVAEGGAGVDRHARQGDQAPGARPPVGRSRGRRRGAARARRHVRVRRRRARHDHRQPPADLRDDAARRSRRVGLERADGNGLPSAAADLRRPRRRSRHRAEAPRAADDRLTAARWRSPGQLVSSGMDSAGICAARCSSRNGSAQ